MKKIKAKPLYTLELYHKGKVSQSYATTDYKKAKRVYSTFSIKYGYPPRVTVDHVRLLVYEADRVFKFKKSGRKTCSAGGGCGVLLSAIMKNQNKRVQTRSNNKRKAVPLC